MLGVNTRCISSNNKRKDLQRLQNVGPSVVNFAESENTINTKKLIKLGKQTINICKTKGLISCAVTAQPCAD